MLIITSLLVILGTVMVYSSTVIMADIRWQTPYLFITKQIFWVIIGIFLMIMMMSVDYRHIQKLARPISVAALLLLIVVLFAGVERGGAKRWLRLGFIGFQPSEFAKYALIVFICDYLDRKRSKLKTWSGMLPLIAVMGVFSFLVGIEPDLGAPVTMFIVFCLLLFVAGAKMKYLFFITVSFIPLAIIEVVRKPYRIERIKHFIASLGSIHSGLYQLDQSILALGSGGIFGKGLGKGTLKMMYLPEPHTDFIFPIIGEELGFLGLTLVIALFIMFAVRGWMISRNAKDYFGALLALGITWLIVFQAFINMGVSCGILPAKGLPLPFLSFGGTSLVLNMMAVGVLLSISGSSTSLKGKMK